MSYVLVWYILVYNMQGTEGGEIYGLLGAAI